jgi:site-specific DNA-methyltransferase (adenine-specific)
VNTEKRAPRNRTITLSKAEKRQLRQQLLTIEKRCNVKNIRNRVIRGDIFTIIEYLPSSFVDVLFCDPPYNLTKRFNLKSFRSMKLKEYMEWMDQWLGRMIRLLKPTASVYICGTWGSSTVIHLLCEKYFTVRNRITFEREKGRGSKKNWKNNSEDIWFATMSDDYTFNYNEVKLKKRVIAPYREQGKPKGWSKENRGKYRLTFPSNIWTDITIPFWSMAENTPHPTQKPEKLLAKIILASSSAGDMVFDPFGGAGTSAVVARKLGRNFTTVEIDEEYCLYALKRLQIARTDKAIQGYSNGIFWERNTPPSEKGHG